MSKKITRREFLKGAGGGLVAGLMGVLLGDEKGSTVQVEPEIEEAEEVFEIDNEPPIELYSGSCHSVFYSASGIFKIR